MQPWKKKKTETGKAYAAFLAYLDQNSKHRSLRKLAREIDVRERTVAGWSSRHDWQERAAAYDVEQLNLALKGRRASQEQVRQRALNKADELLSVMISLADGSFRLQEEEPRNHRGDPVNKTSTRLQAAIHILNVAGITVPKRIELTGQDGKAIELEARHELTAYTEEELRAVLKAAQKAAARANKG